jgi:hypothetical protein
VDNAEHSEQLAEALRLLGNIVRFNHMQPGTGRRCISITKEGMVKVEGFTGYFSPSLFVIDGETEAVPVIGSVN